MRSNHPLSVEQFLRPHPHFRHTLAGLLLTTLFIVSLVGWIESTGALNSLKWVAMGIVSVTAENRVRPQVMRSDGRPAVEVVEILISQDEYRQHFGASSPLDKGKLAALFESWRRMPPEALPQAVMIDLDLTPVRGDGSSDPSSVRLDRSLLALASALARQGGMIAMLYPMIPGSPGSIGASCDSNGRCPEHWRDRLISESQGAITFADAGINPHLYLRRPDSRHQSLGVAVGQAIHHGSVPQLGVDRAQSSELSAWPLLRPYPSVAALSWTAAMTPDQNLAGQLVVLGGAFDPRDRVSTFYGESVPGATVHAWVAISEAHWLSAQQASAGREWLLFLGKIVVAWILAIGLGRLWFLVANHGRVFKLRVASYTVSLMVMLIVPIGLLLFSVPLIELGVQPITWAGILLGLLIDLMFSPQEALLTSHQEHETDINPDSIDWALLLLWWLLQWGVIVCYVVKKAKGFSPAPMALTGFLLIAAFIWINRAILMSQHHPPHRAGARQSLI